MRFYKTAARTLAHHNGSVWATICAIACVFRSFTVHLKRIRPLALRFLHPGQRYEACLLAAAGGAGFLDCLFDSFTGFPCAFLNAAEEFFLLAFDVLEIVIGKFGPFLLQLALGDVPVAFDFEFIHNDLVFGLLDGNWFALT
jgi:hypothetical protein